MALHKDIRIRDQGDTRFVFNHGPEAVDVSDVIKGYNLLIGAAELEPCGVIVAKKM
jgi:beta-galactosidase